jgi:hypothetical protein
MPDGQSRTPVQLSNRMRPKPGGRLTRPSLSDILWPLSLRAGGRRLEVDWEGFEKSNHCGEKEV